MRVCVRVLLDAFVCESMYMCMCVCVDVYMTWRGEELTQSHVRRTLGQTLGVAHLQRALPHRHARPQKHLV